MNVQNRGIAESLIGLIAIWLIVREIPGYAASQVAAVLLDARIATAELAAIQLVHLVASVLLGVILLIWRGHLARSLVRDGNDLTVGATELVTAGTALIGLWLLVSGLASLFGHIWTLRGSWTAMTDFVVPSIASIVVGAIVFACSKRVGRLWGTLEHSKRDVA